MKNLSYFAILGSGSIIIKGGNVGSYQKIFIELDKAE